MKRNVFIVAAVVTAAVVGLVQPASAAVITVNPGQSIQAAVNAAPPGSTIFVRPGTYTETVTIQKDGIQLIGSGAAVTTIAAPEIVTGGCNDIFGPTGVCAFGTINFETFSVITPVRNVRITGFTIRDFEGSGVLAFGADNTTIASNRFTDNHEYGVFALLSTRTQIANNTATGSDDAGIYVGGSPNATATISGNTATNNGFGIFLRAASVGTASGNTTTGNCAGFVLLGEPDFTTRWSITGNQINNNTRACAGNEEAPPLSGVGILMFRANDNTISGNTVNGNVPGGETFFSGGIFMDFSTGNRVIGNNAHGNAPADILNFSEGNFFAANNCGSSIPPGIC